MDTLDKFYPIKTELLSQKYYFQSLVEQARRCNLFSEKELITIQNDLLLILAKCSNKWSGGKSSSIPSEKAQDIMSSILFVIGIQLKSYQSAQDAIDMLKSQPLEVLFENGLKLIRRKLVLSRHLQRKIIDNLLDTSNVYYQSTIVDGINGFFKLYRPQFAANEIHITADYPVFMDVTELQGIEFIEKYLRCIKAENEFCVHFSSQDIHNLLCGLTLDYQSVPLNIFEPVLLSALGLVICKKSPKRLDLSEKDLFYLYQLFRGKLENEVQGYLKKALIRLNENMDFSKESMQYAILSIPKLAVTIINAVKLKTLDKIFIIPIYPECESQITLSYGDRMNDGAYQVLVEQILDTDNSKEKVKLILNEVHSLADFLDIVSDIKLFEDDFELLINMLPLSTFAILLSQYPNDDFLDRESELLLYAALQKRWLKLSLETKKQIKSMIKAIRREEI